VSARVLRSAVVLVGCLALASAFAAHDALAAPWCGGPTSEDRSAAVAGQAIRVVYAVPSDGVDRFADVAPRISNDVDGITGWWQSQDGDRAPRFDLASFPCGLQADILVLHLTDTSETLRPEPGRVDRLDRAVRAAAGFSPWVMDLVYYDGPTDDSNLCGEGGRAPSDVGIAVVFVQACAFVPTAATAAHELLHALGALPSPGPPHACPNDAGHPCDSASDILYPYASDAPLGALTLDVGRDDYYGHAGTWLDVQDSPWLRLVRNQRPLTLTVVGTGSVESDVPGLACATSCTTEWNPATDLTLEPTAGAGQRFVTWSGACTGDDLCDLSVSDATAVTALFAPAHLRLVIALRGKGVVAGGGISCRVARCVQQPVSYTRLVLTARPAKGWRFGGWTGACTGKRVSCTLAMERASSVRARFVRL